MAVQVHVILSLDEQLVLPRHLKRAHDLRFLLLLFTDELKSFLLFLLLLVLPLLVLLVLLALLDVFIRVRLVPLQTAEVAHELRPPVELLLRVVALCLRVQHKQIYQRVPIVFSHPPHLV
jgi:hypothetical protein